MTDEQLKTLMIEWAGDYCNTTFNPDDLPAGVALFAENSVAFFKSQTGVQSETLGKYSVTNINDIPASLVKMLQTYRKPPLIKGC